MSDAHRQSTGESELEREIREGRKFTLEEAVARMAGPGAMKGESPVTRLQQAKFEIEAWLESRLVDSSGALRTALKQYVHENSLLLTDFERPLEVAAGCCRQLLESNYLLEELVRKADAEWARSMNERPYFDRKGAPPHSDDPYTIESVRQTLQRLVYDLSGRQ